MKPSKGRRGTGRYRQKVRLGMVPTSYDRNSQRFLSGAWKNLEPSQRMINQRALGNAGKPLPPERQPARR